MNDDLRDQLAQWLRRRPLLIALDFDGVLAPIVERPQDARALPGTAELLQRLASTDGLHVALVSGRALTSLRTVAQVPDGSPLLLVGSHGAEVDGSDVHLDDDARDVLAAVHEVFVALAADQPGVHVETKPAGVVLHTRRAARDVAARVTGAALAAADRPGCHVTQGKEVVEVSVIETGKGVAIERLRDELGVVGVLYVGDDVTDENAFAVLRPGDLGIKVGDGDTRAGWRVADPEQVQDLLRELARG